jgi:hypothetical protein
MINVSGDNHTGWWIIPQSAHFTPAVGRPRVLLPPYNNAILFLYPVLFIGKNETEG